MYSYNTVSEAINELRKRGFTIDFNLPENFFDCDEKDFNPDDFEIVEVYRFEGDTDPADEAVVYAIQSKTGVKGVLVNGFGISSEEWVDEIIEKLHIHHEE